MVDEIAQECEYEESWGRLDAIVPLEGTLSSYPLLAMDDRSA